MRYCPHQRRHGGGGDNGRNDMKRKMNKATLVNETLASLKKRYGFAPSRNSVVLLEASNAVIRFEVNGHTYNLDRECGAVGEVL